jgi:hypothetical protein
MTDPTQPPTDVDPIVLLRDPPAPPGYVDPLEESPRLRDASNADPEEPPEDDQARGVP